MVRVIDVFDFLNGFAPVSTKMDFDNVGFLAGFSQDEVRRILVSLDITSEVIEEAAEKNVQLIVSHHPMFFSLKSVTDSDVTGGNVAKLLRKGLNAICMHTNLDAAKQGVNHALAVKAGITDPEILTNEGIGPDGEAYSCGRFGTLSKEMTMEEYLPFIKDVLNTAGLRYYDAGRPVFKLASVGGSGGSYLHDAYAKGCDTLLTADVKYDVFLEAKALGMNIIDGDHFCTENPVVPVLKNALSERFADVDVIISEKHGQTARFFA